MTVNTSEIEAIESARTRLHKLAELRAEVKGGFTSLQARLHKIKVYLDDLGEGDNVVPQAVIDDASALYSEMSAASDTILKKHYVLIEGKDPEEE